MNTNYTIYCHRNKINNKAYIGQTCQKLERRWREGEGYSHCSYFYHAIKKYGWNNFEHIILMDNLSLEEANKNEERLIKLFDTTNPDKGYNLEYGGTNKTHSEETKQKISNSLKGLFSGEKNPMYGKTTAIAKNVLCVETGEVFPSAIKAGQKYGIDNSSISKVCRGIRNYAGIHPQTGEQLHWKYITKEEADAIKEYYQEEDFFI